MRLLFALALFVSVAVAQEKPAEPKDAKPAEKKPDEKKDDKAKEEKPKDSKGAVAIAGRVVQSQLSHLKLAIFGRSKDR